ncbi:MAG: PAS domain-containing protein [Candidatus Zixiibacteriota bacterium]
MSNKNDDHSGSKAKLTGDATLSLLQRILESINDAIVAVDEKLDIVFFNEAFRRFCERLDSPIQDGAQINIERLAFFGKASAAECRQVLESGKTVLSSLQATHGKLLVSARVERSLVKPTESSRFVVSRLHQISYDEHAAIRPSEWKDLCSAIINNAPIGISIRSRAGALLGYNQAWQSIWHLSDQDIAERQRKPRLELKFDERDDYLGDWKERVRSVYEVGGSLYIPELQVFLRRKKKHIWVSQRFYALMKDDNTVDRVVIMTVDITDAVLSRQALQISEEKYRQLVNIIPASIAIIDYEGYFLYINEYAADKRKIWPKEAVGQRFYEYYASKELGEERLANIRHVIDTGEEFQEESQTILETGDFYHFVHIRPLKDAAGKITSALVMALDITEHKLAEKELRMSEARYRMLMESLPSSVLIVDRDGNYKFVNKTAAARRGLPPEHFTGKNISEFYLHEDAQYILSEVRDVVATRQRKHREVSLIIDDELCWFDSHALPVFNDDGTIEDIILIAYETTERKRAEQELAESESKYRVLLNNLPANISVFSYDGTIVFMNEFAARTLGSTAQEMVGKNHRDIFPSHIADHQMASIRRVIDSGVSETVESVSVVGNMRRWFKTTVQPYPMAEGNMKAGMIVALDITDAKEAHREIRRSQEKLNSTISSMDDLVFVIDSEGRFVEYFQPSKRTKLFVQPEEFLGRFVEDILPAEVAELMQQKIQLVINTHRVEQLDYALDMPDGKQWYNAKISILKYAEDEIGGVTVVARNITDRKTIENELIEAQKELENRVRLRTEELRDANIQLQVEREALQQKNIALQEILNQIEAGKQQMSAGIQANVDKIVLPLLESLEYKIPEKSREYIQMLRKNLSDVTAPFMNSLEAKYAELTPRELQICGHIRNGMSCKQIASTLEISVQTVLKQRSIIRKKLGIANKKINLASYLKSMK